MQPTYERQSKTKLIATVIAVIVIAGVVLIADHLKSERAETASAVQASTSQGAVSADPTTSTVSATNTTATPTTTSTYKDGTYSASSSYYVPHGYENIQVTVTLKGGVVISSSVTNSEGDPDSASFQQAFSAEYKNYVIGKSISGLQLNRISGASDTTQGFDDALSKIASQAKA